VYIHFHLNFLRFFLHSEIHPSEIDSQYLSVQMTPLFVAPSSNLIEPIDMKIIGFYSPIRLFVLFYDNIFVVNITPYSAII